MRFVGGALLLAWVGWLTLTAVLVLGMNGGPDGLGYLSMTAFFAVTFILDWRRRRSANRSAKSS